MGMSGSYGRFLLMIVTAMVAMHLLMYLNSYRLIEHAWFSETRVFMTLIMGGVMMIVMLAFMQDMYASRKVNSALLAGAVLMVLAGIVLVRSQATVTDEDYLQGMIPHHSIAILTSERARIEDLRVRELADRISATQQQEIREMSWLIEDIRSSGRVESPAEADARQIPFFP